MLSTARYRFGEVSHRGMLGAIRPGQLLVGVLGGGWGVAMVDVSPNTAGALAAVLGVVAATTTATLPVEGRTLEQWAPVAMRWTLRGLRERFSRARSAKSAGSRVSLPTGSDRRRPNVIPPEPQPPRELRGVRIVEIPYRGRTIGAIAERKGHRLTVVLVGRAPGFALADDEEQELRLAVWGDVLKASCRGAVRRVQWIERTAPVQSDGLARWLHEQRDPDLSLRGPLGESYLELMNASADATREHEVLLAIQIDAALLRKDVREQRERALIASAEQIARGLERAQVHVDSALTAGGLARALRVAYDPYVRVDLAALRAGAGTDELSEPAAWPVAARGAWGHYQTDGAVHATYEVGGWPRAEVGPAFLGPLLGPSDQVRSVSVVFEPLDPLRSIRQAEFDVTRYETDHQVRRRLGQVETTRGRQAFEAVRLRESELASGHAEVRMAGFVTVTAPDLDQLQVACEQVVGHAGRANLELRRLYGHQPEAFTFTLPLCRGLR